MSTSTLHHSIILNCNKNATYSQLYVCKSIVYRSVLLLFSIFFTFTSPELLAQVFNLGFPTVNNFSPSSYNGGTQNWRIDISPDGVIYVANNEGLLIFDGNEWKVHPLPNGTIARSLDYSNDTIFIGGQDELGYFAKNEFGELQYHSLWDLIPANQNIADIWDLSYINGKVLFRNFKNIFSIHLNKFRYEHENALADFMINQNQKIWYNQKGLGLIQIDKDQKRIQNLELKNLANKEILSLIENENRMLIFTREDGIFIKSSNSKFRLWECNAQDYLIKNKITTAIELRNKNIAVGTRLGGLVVLDPYGKALYVLDKSSGLQNNSINTIKEDNWSNLWIGTYFGIDRINFGSGFNTFYPDKDFEGAVYDVALWSGSWWFATSNGLYSITYKAYNSPFEELDVKLVTGSEGQVWGLDPIDDQLLVAHENGAYIVEDNELVTDLGIADGVWKFLKLDEKHMAVGCYNGLYIFAKSGSSWKQLYKLQEFSESSRILMVDLNGDIWISHPYRGIFRISFTDNYSKPKIKKYNENSGYSCIQRNYIFDVLGEPVVANQCGVYNYNFQMDSFLLDTSLQSIIGRNNDIFRLFSEQEGIWYISENETGVIPRNSLSGKLLDKILFPHIGKSYVGGFENLFPIDTNSLILCANKGVKIFQKVEKNSNQNLRGIIAAFNVQPTNRLLNLKQKTIHKLGPRERNINLHIRSNGLIDIDLKGYEYKLEGFDDNWTFSSLPYKEYNNLAAGKYSLWLRVIDNLGQKSQPTKLNFEIEPFWYKSNFAKFVYFLLVLSSIALILILPNKKYKKNTANLVIKQQETEKELEVVRKEKLEDEIKFKNNELANATLHLVQKKQTINTLREELDRLQKNASGTKISKSLKHLNSLLKSDDRLEDDWEKFTLLFDQVHLDFIQKLKSNYPQLTPKDQKLCAFLRMNLSTKEIAPLMNISVRGVEISRYRLRKKMNLESSNNLTEVMLNL